jgi:hypothetical protein
MSSYRGRLPVETNVSRSSASSRPVAADCSVVTGSMVRSSAQGDRSRRPWLAVIGSLQRCTVAIPLAGGRAAVAAPGPQARRTPSTS